MSRWYTERSDGTTEKEIDSMDDCKHMINEICCLDVSDQCCDFPDREFCMKKCPYFDKEDGII